MLPDGFVLQARYRIVRRLSQGGMGAVYLAEDANLGGSLCAVKQTLDLGADLDEYVKKRFQEEMQVLSRVRHRSIPTVRDYFQNDRGCFLVMDYIEGDTLEQELAQKGPFDPGKAVDDILGILEVAQFLHGQQLLHRDIKPANLIREKASGRLMLVDFGLARSAAAVSTVQTSVGTLGYSAYEQLEGKPEVRSDVYSIGATLSEMLSGVRPTFAGVEKLDPSFDKTLAAIVRKATQRDKKDRYASAAEMSAALWAWRGVPAEATTVMPRERRRLLPGAVLTTLLLAALGWWFYPRPPATLPPDPGITGNLFQSRGDGIISLGEDVGLFWVQGEDAEKRGRTLAARLNFLYHHQCFQCGAWMLEPPGIKVGRYQDGKVNELVVFYAHMHGDQFAYGPELLATLDEPLAQRLGSTPRYAAGYWRDLLRDVVALSRGETSSRTVLGASFQPIASKIRGASLDRLRQVLSGLSSKEVRTLRQTFRHVPDDFRLQPDTFPEKNGFSPLAN